ncbi:uncharacterized protein TNCV_33591 [Trichonephila clavipes]|nr:uncharacterized protein TNCV_33591 [Trichonephila clavipes]
MYLALVRSCSPPVRWVSRGVRYATALYMYTLQDALLICYKQSPTHSIAFSQSVNSPRLIEDSDIINNLTDYEDGQEEPNSLRADKIYARIQISNNWESIFLK